MQSWADCITGTHESSFWKRQLSALILSFVQKDRDMTQTTTSAAIGKFVAGTYERQLPPEVMDIAKQSVVDWFAVCLAACSDPEGRMVAGMVHGWNSRGGAIAVDGHKGAAAPIALINGTYSHTLDFDDFHIDSVHHAGGTTLAAVLALGMARKCSGREILAAFVSGFEVGTNLGLNDVGLKLGNGGWHPTCVLGHFSAAAACAALLGFDQERAERTIGLAAVQVGGLMAAAGTISKPFIVGKSAMDGVLAAELAEKGATAPGNLLDIGRPGLFATLFQAEVLPNVDRLGTEWQITRNAFKPYSACQLTHASIDAARVLAQPQRAGDIVSARAYVHPFAQKIAGRTNPATLLESRFSLKHCIAMGLLGHGAGPADFEERLADKNVIALRDRVDIMTTDEVARSAAKLEVTWKDGTVTKETTAAALGSTERPMSWADLDAKFLSAAAPRLGNRARAMLDALRRFDEPDALAEISAILVEKPTTLN
jgi:2-methylcitrate dehydratase PrpD